MKYVYGTLLAVVLVTVFSKISFAAEDRQPKTVSGKVRYEDLSVATDIQIAITCDTVTRTDVTNINGNYSVTFEHLECEQFDTVFVTASNDTHSGSDSKAVTFALNVTMPDIILETITSEPTLTNTPVPETTISNSPSPEVTQVVSPTQEVPTSVPEFGMISGILAVGGSLLSYVKIKKK